jgi:hypothetical protein
VFGRLDELLERLSGVPARTAALAAPELTKRLQTEFRAGTDPYGQRWAPLRPSTIAKGRRPPPLSDTYTLRNGTNVRPRRSGRAGLALTVGAPYGRFHQSGTRHMVARRIAPQKGLPAAWRAILVNASKRAGQASVLAARGVV